MLIKLSHIKPLGEHGYKILGERLDTIIVHRIAVGTRAADIVHAFTGGLPEAARSTGHRMPYHFIVEGDGACVQCISLSRQGAHARAWNTHSVAVAAIGDFRRGSPSVAQWRAAVGLVALLTAPQGWAVWGHDEVPGGSSDPHKQCPGARWPMDSFRADVESVGVTAKDIDDFWRYVRC